MKKLTCLILAMLMCFTFAACGTPAAGGTNSNEHLQGNPTAHASPEAVGAKETDPATTEEGALPPETQPENEDPTTGRNDGIDDTTPPTEDSEVTTPTVDAGEDPTSPTEEDPTVPTEKGHTHQYSTKVTEPTCEKEGYTTYTCNCGDTYKDDVVEALGHDFLVDVVEPTPTERGFTAHTCMRDGCGYHYKDNYTDPIGGETEPEPEPTEPPVTHADPYEVAKYLLQYINQFRAEEGVAPLTYLPGMSKVAKYRSKQLVYNFAHDTDDIREAHAYYKYGEYIDMTKHGLPESENYYTAHAPEAIGKAYGFGYSTMSAEELGRRMAEAYRASSGHWRYLGSAEYLYIGVGTTYADGAWYDCVMVGAINYG